MIGAILCETRPDTSSCRRDAAGAEDLEAEARRIEKRGCRRLHHLDGAAHEPMVTGHWLCPVGRGLFDAGKRDTRGQGFFKSHLSFHTYISVVRAAASPFVGVGDAERVTRKLIMTTSQQAQLVEVTAHRVHEHNFDVEMMNVMATR